MRLLTNDHRPKTPSWTVTSKPPVSHPGLESFRALRLGLRFALRSGPRQGDSYERTCAPPAFVGTSVGAPGPFDPPLDAPHATGGRVCSLAVVTSLFGTVDALEPLDELEKKHRALLLYENGLGLASCWFAFVVDEGDRGHRPRLVMQGEVGGSFGRSKWRCREQEGKHWPPPEQAPAQCKDCEGQEEPDQPHTPDHARAHHVVNHLPSLNRVDLGLRVA